MENVPEALAFVKGQETFHDQKAQLFEPASPRRSAQHRKFYEQFAALAAFIERQANYVDQLEERAKGLTPSLGGAVQLTLRLEDIDGLPDELMQELSITDGDKIDFTIQALMNERGGVMSLDQLLIALFRKTGEIHKRSNLNARLYRMTKKNALFDVPGRKGVYSIRPLTDEESRSLEGPATADAAT